MKVKLPANVRSLEVSHSILHLQRIAVSVVSQCKGRSKAIYTRVWPCIQQKSLASTRSLAILLLSKFVAGSKGKTKKPMSDDRPQEP